MIPDGARSSSPRRPATRRDLFRLRPAAPPPTAPAPAPPEVPSGSLFNVSRPLMGSYFEVRVGVGVPGGVELAGRALDVVEGLEAQLTIYDEGSEVSRLNATAHLGPVAVEAGLFDLLDRAVDLGRRTGGAYDVAAGALSEAWGFVRGPRRVPDAATLAVAKGRSGSGRLILDRGSRTAAFDRPGVVVNLGSIGKGYAIDRAVATIRAHWWPTAAVVHGGRSSLYALGSPPGDFGGRWCVAVRDPADPAVPLGTVHLRNRGMGTSGDLYQRFEAGGRTYGHIIDPRTGEPPDAGRLDAVTVLAPTAAEADSLSTAFYLLGPDGAAPILADRPDLAAIFADRPDPAGPTRVRTLGLGPADFTPDPGRRPS